MNLTHQIKYHARKIGFHLVGIASASPHPDFDFFNAWINKGYAGSMDWLIRSREKRDDPAKVLPGAKSLIVCGLKYYRGFPFSTNQHDPARGWISCYAWGEDYHRVVLEKLEILEQFIRKEAPAAQLKSYVDTGPILERSYAALAGLGWIGKNTCLINQREGSYLFLGEILTDLDLDSDRPVADHCGTCTRCLDSCPTQALTPYEMNASQCVSYLTIEHRGEIDPALSKKMGNHLVGCDICQDVCPWNQKVIPSGELAFDPKPGNFNPPLDSLTEITKEEFSICFKNSAIKRVKRDGLIRNIEIAQKNG